MALDQLLEPLEAHGWLGGAHAGPDLDRKEVRRHRRLRVAAPRIDDAGGGDFEAVHPHSKLFGQSPHGHGFAARLLIPITSFRLEPRSPSKTLAQLRPGRPDIDPPGWVQAPV